MKKFLKGVFLAIALLITLPSCIMDDNDYTSTVANIETTTISYYDTDGNGWICKELSIYENNKKQTLMFPIQYDGDIKVGTRINWDCHKVTSFEKEHKKVIIDWEGTKRNDI